MGNKYVKVMFGNKSFASGGLEYKIDEVNISKSWNPLASNPKEFGGFNFSKESKIFRWLVRGDTIYEVEIPKDAEVVEIESESSPGGVFRSNKIILHNPKLVDDGMAMELYLKSDLPEKSYYKAMAGCVVRNYKGTVYRILEDRVNKRNIDLVLSEYEDFMSNGNKFDANNLSSFGKEIYDRLLEIRNIG